MPNDPTHPITGGEGVVVQQSNAAASAVDAGSRPDRTAPATTNNNNLEADSEPEDERLPVQADTVEKAMGDLLDQVHKETNFPVEAPGEGPPSTRLSYDVSAQLSVDLQTNWTLFEGFELTDIHLGVGVSKRTRSNAALRIALEARMQLGETTLRIRGEIPRLQEDEETDFILTVDALAALTSMPLDAFLPTASSGDVPFDAVKGVIEPSVADQLFLMRAGGYAAGASLTITRRPATPQSPVTYYVKSFQVRVMGDFDWEILKGSLTLRKGALSIVATRAAPSDKLDWALTVAGTLLVAGDTPVQIMGRFIIENNQCTGLSFQANVGAFMGVSLPGLLDVVAGDGASREAEKTFQPPQSLNISSRSTSYPLTMSVDLRNSGGEWSLAKAEASMFLHGLGWSPLDGITLESLSFLLKAEKTVAKQTDELQRSDLPSNSQDATLHDAGSAIASDAAQHATGDPTTPRKLTYLASVRGALVLMGVPLVAELQYNSDENTLTIQASVPEDAICSLRNMSFGIAQKLLPPTDVQFDPKYDLSRIVDDQKVPQGCPVGTDWALHGNLKSRRQCTLLVKSSALARASLTATYEGSLFTWKLSEGLQVLNAGLFFDLDFQTPASTDDPSIFAFVYGSVALSGRVLSGFVACSKTPDRKSFDMFLTIHDRPRSSLGLRPTDLMEAKELLGEKVDASGWSLPESLPPNCSLEDAVTSFEAAFKASFLSDGPDKPTVLTGVAARLATAGSWPIVRGLELKDVVFGVVATRKDPVGSSPWRLLASLYGRSTQVLASGGRFDIWCHALLSKDDHSTDFTATLNACTADTAEEPPDTSQLTPANLTQLQCLGKFPLEVSPEKQPPPDCPFKVDDLIKSTSASCTLRVTKEETPKSEWNLSEISFTLLSTETWALSTVKLVLDAAALHVTVSSPTDATKRSIVASLAARMTMGTTQLDALLSFSSAENRKILEGYLTTTSTVVNIAQLAKELAPQQSDKAIPDGTTSLELLPTAKIRFWLDTAQPKMLLAATGAGRLLYFLHRPDPAKDEYTWLLSLSLQDVTDVFPWLDTKVTGAFSLQDIGIQMLNRDVIVQNLITYLSLAQQGSDIIEPSQQASPLALLRCLEQTDTLQAGGWFIASVNLNGGGSMKDALALAVSPNSTPVVIFYAQVLSGASNMKCSLRLSNLSLWGDSLVLSGAMTYSPSESIIAGDVILTLPDLSSHFTPKIMAKVFMDKEKTIVAAKLEAGGAGGTDVEDPFDMMYNTKLAVLGVEATYLKPKDGNQHPSSTITVSGSLRLGPAGSTWVVQADVVFIDGKARLVRGRKIDQTDTKAISDKLLAPKASVTSQGAAWPSDFPMFSFRSASIYYARSVKPKEDPLELDGVTYYYGYCIAAELVVFGAPFTITASLPENRSGLKVAGEYKQTINLGFAKLHGYKYEDKTLPWPSLIINTTNEQREYMATSGVELFDIKGYQITLSYKTQESHEKDRLTGTLEYKGKLLGWENPSISLVYQDGYLAVDNWPMGRDGEDVNKDFLQNAVRDASKVFGCKDCGDLVDLVLDKTIKTRFDFKLRGPRSGGNPVKGDKYFGSIHWSYVVTITIPGFPDTDIALDMEPVDLTIDEGFTSDSIWKALFKLLVAQAPNIGTAIMKDKAKFVTLIGLMNMKGVAKKLLNNLLCREYDADNVKKEADAQLEANKDEPGKQATSTEVAFAAVTSAVAFGAAVVEFGLAVGVALEFLGLGLLFGAGVSLAAHLIPLLVDKTRADALTLLMEEYKRHLARCDTAQENATTHLREVARPSEAPAMSWDTDKPGEASVAVDWSNSLPKPPAGARDTYFGDYSSLSWEVAYSFADNPDATSGVTVLPPTQDRTCVLRDPAFPQQHAVYVWFRSSFVATTREGIKTVTTAWSPSGPPLTHPLYLPAPKGIDVAISNGPLFDQVSMTISEPKAVQYRVVFAADDQSTSTPAYETVLSGDVAAHEVPVLDFQLGAGGPPTFKAFIREISSDTVQFRDSPWTTSDKALTIVLEDLRLSVSQVGADALLEWNSLGSAPKDFTVVAVSPGGKTISTTTAEQSVEGDRIRARLQAPEFRGGEAVVFAVRRLPIAPDVLLAFERKTLAFRMDLAVSNESFFDAEAGFYELYVTSVVALTGGQEAVVTATSADGGTSTKAQANVEFYDAAKGLAKLTAVALPIFGPAPGTVSVEITVESGQPAKQSPPWIMPDVTEVPRVSKLHTYFDKTLRVGWTCIGKSSRMDLVTVNLDPFMTGRTIPDSETWGDYLAEVSDTDMDRLIKSKQVRIQIWCTTSKATWKAKEKLFTLPDLAVWNAPDKTVNGASVAPASSLTDMSMWNPGNPGALWWLNSDVTRFEGLLRTDETDGWTTAGDETAVGTVRALDGGSSVASCSRDTDHQEVLWIDGNGGIRGMFRRGGPNFRLPSDYTFSGAGTAATARGGSLVALACAPITMDLWYVTPDGLVRNAHWDGSRSTGWAAPTTVAGGLDASVDDLSILTACSAGTGVAELFWVQKDTSNGAVRWTIQNRRCGDTRAASPLYDSQDVLEGVRGTIDPAPNTKVHAMYLESSAETMIAWITATGTVQVAVRKGGTGSGLSLPSWINLWTVGPQHGASPRSRLCSDSAAILGRMDSALPGFYWVADDGCVVVADYQGGDHTGNGGYWSAYKHTVNVGWRSGTPDPPTEITVCSGTANSVRLFWVGGDGCVWNMRRVK